MPELIDEKFYVEVYGLRWSGDNFIPTTESDQKINIGKNPVHSYLLLHRLIKNLNRYSL